ncbi:MAG: terminase small subunit [Pseudomonadota bacterium]
MQEHTTNKNNAAKATIKAKGILNQKQKSFVQAYAAGQSAYDAAVHAGYSQSSAKTTARRLLENPDIQVALQSLHGEGKAHELPVPKGKSASSSSIKNSPKLPTLLQGHISEESISKEDVVRELAAIGFASMNDICTWSEDGVTLHHSDDIPHGARAAIAEVRESGTARGGVLVKLHPKLRALEMLGRHLGMFNTAQLSTGQGLNSMAFDAAQTLFNDTDNALPEAILHKLNAVYGKHGRAYCEAQQSSAQAHDLQCQSNDSTFAHDYDEGDDFREDFTDEDENMDTNMVTMMH